MKKTWKVFLCTTLVMCTLSSACIFGATNDADQSSTLPVEASQNDTGISSRANFLSLDISITGYDYAWRQMDGYTSFRAWVENTTDALMIVTITYPSGKTKNLYVTAQRILIIMQNLVFIQFLFILMPIHLVEQ